MSTSLSEQEKTRLWLEAWKLAGDEMDAAKTRDLRALSEEDAARCFDALAWPSEGLWISPEKAGSEGLIEQQRLFSSCRQALIRLLSPHRNVLGHGQTKFPLSVL